MCQDETQWGWPHPGWDSYLTYALCEAVYRDSARDSSVAGAASEPPVMATAGVVDAVANFPVGRIPNSDRMALKAAAKPVSDTSGGPEGEGAYKMSGAITAWD